MLALIRLFFISSVHISHVQDKWLYKRSSPLSLFSHGYFLCFLNFCNKFHLLYSPSLGWGHPCGKQSLSGFSGSPGLFLHNSSFLLPCDAVFCPSAFTGPGTDRPSLEVSQMQLAGAWTQHSCISSLQHCSNLGRQTLALKTKSKFGAIWPCSCGCCRFLFHCTQKKKRLDNIIVHAATEAFTLSEWILSYCSWNALSPA